ncbi:amidase [Evansella clarkii]|uniref:amidase n=1 Tax=Evansella clarkii TaxID=79879 RepID=UPI0009973B19|nr:amidase family protein [Evansella clarkii]
MSEANDLHYLSATQLNKLIHSKELSPVELMDLTIERINKINPEINAFCTISGESARNKARLAEEKIMKNESFGLLHGIPTAIKDLTPTQGITTTFGSRAYKNFIPEHDSECVKRLKLAGAIVTGKTNTPEFGYKGTTDNDLFGVTKNPWDTNLTAGGSSGGSAAAVAAGLVPLAEGSDGGGSIRIPASLCGVYGFKPTFGRIPFDLNIENLFSAHNPFVHLGTLTRTVEDAYLMYSVMAGPDQKDPFCLPETIEYDEKRLLALPEEMKVAYSRDLGLFRIDHEVDKLTQQGVYKLEGLGCKAEKVELSFNYSKKEIDRAFYTLWFSQMAINYSHLLEKHSHDLSEDIIKIITKGREINIMDYKKVERIRSHVWGKIQGIFNEYDLLITPTLAVPPFPHNLKGPDEINGIKANPGTDWMLTSLFNLTGHPAASMPAGFTEKGLPVGMQLIAPRFKEMTILQTSYAFEQAYPWTGKRPVG